MAGGPRFLSARFLYSILCIALMSQGCGGGSGKSSSRQSKIIARERAIASVKLMRGIFAIAGLGRKATRASAGVSRLHLFASVLRHTRDIPQGYDAETGLYYVVTTNPDGSGRQDLFADVGLTKPAGNFKWKTPVWNQDKVDSYPAKIYSEYRIQEGDFAGETGTLDSTLKDSTGDNGSLHIDLTTKANEHAVADFEIVNGVVSGKDAISLPDGTNYGEEDVTQSDGTTLCTITFADESVITLNMLPDGTMTEVLKESDGTVDATGTVQADGMDTISYSDGSQESVDVDIVDSGDASK